MSACQPGSRRVLVVCLGNHCRSPGAAALARHWPPGMEVRSAGLADKHQGRAAHPADPGRRSPGLRPGHLGAQVTAQMLDWADLVLAMDSTVLAELRALAGNRASPKLRLYAEGRDVPDPWGQDADAFSACARLIEEAARQQAA